MLPAVRRRAAPDQLERSVAVFRDEADNLFATVVLADPGCCDGMAEQIELALSAAGWAPDRS